MKKQESEDLSQKISSKFQNVINESHFSISIFPTIDIEKGVSYKTGLINNNIPEAKNVDILNCGTGLQSILSDTPGYGQKCQRNKRKQFL